MSLETLLGENLAAPIGAIFTGLNKLFPNETDRLKAQTTLESLQQQPLLWQALIDQQEAMSNDRFKSSWRPLCGYICAIAFAWSYVLQPMITFILGLFHVQVIALPHLEMNEIMPVLLGMLGLGAMRTYEKTK